jgi:demethylmenaquinone methyltransferase/2-methoxy-6-polyprenyl-1,4-benzoquinol methylase
MFAAIARRYDLLNHLLSAGLDRRWRQRAAAEALRVEPGRMPGPSLPGHVPQEAKAGPRGQRRGHAAPIILDVCTGTGDLAMAILRRRIRPRVIGCDFCQPMLARAAAKFARAGVARRATLLEADALALPLADASADAVTCGWGLRNLADPRQGLAEMARAVRPGGRVVLLEFHWPRGLNVLAGVFALYFRRILPRLGAHICGGDLGAYSYLVASIDAFGPPERVAAMLAGAGLRDVRVVPLPGGVASIFVGVKAGAPGI